MSPASWLAHLPPRRAVAANLPPHAQMAALRSLCFHDIKLARRDPAGMLPCGVADVSTGEVLWISQPRAERLGCLHEPPTGHGVCHAALVPRLDAEGG